MTVGAVDSALPAWHTVVGLQKICPARSWYCNGTVHLAQTRSLLDVGATICIWPTLQAVQLRQLVSWAAWHTVCAYVPNGHELQGVQRFSPLVDVVYMLVGQDETQLVFSSTPEAQARQVEGVVMQREHGEPQDWHELADDEKNWLAGQLEVHAPFESTSGDGQDRQLVDPRAEQVRQVLLQGVQNAFCWPAHTPLRKYPPGQLTRQAAHDRSETGVACTVV